MNVAKYQTLLFDMDGVLAEVSKSYRQAILSTCHYYGATAVTSDTITMWKARGNANDDWKLTFDLVQNDPNGQKNITLEQIIDKFEELYQGHGEIPGLYKLETLIPSIEILKELRKRSKPGMGIVTGRPRKDCIQFLQDYNLMDFFDAHYCMEDGPSKPHPYPVQQCCKLLGVTPSKSVVLIGDTPDDIGAAVSAGCSGIGVTTPEANNEQAATMNLAMLKRGADIVLPPGFADLVDMVQI